MGVLAPHLYTYGGGTDINIFFGSLCVNTQYILVNITQCVLNIMVNILGIQSEMLAINTVPGLVKGKGGELNKQGLFDRSPITVLYGLHQIKKLSSISYCYVFDVPYKNSFFASK